MLENRDIMESDLVTLVSDKEISPSASRKPYEYLDEEWGRTRLKFST